MTRSFWAPPVAAIVAGLVLLLAGAAPWVTTLDQRSVGGVVLTEPDDSAGTVFAPAAVVAGLGAVVAGTLLAVLRGRPRRAVSVLVVVTGTVAAGLVVLGWIRAAGADGSVTASPLFALAAALAVAAAGLAGLRAPVRPPRSSRYRVANERTVDDEWSLATDDDSG